MHIQIEKVLESKKDRRTTQPVLQKKKNETGIKLR